LKILLREMEKREHFFCSQSHCNIPHNDHCSTLLTIWHNHDDSMEVEEAHDDNDDDDNHDAAAGNIQEENENLIKIVEACIQDVVLDHHELVNCVSRMLREMRE